MTAQVHEEVPMEEKMSVALKEVSDVVEWLKTLEFDEIELELYTKAFKRAAIDGPALDELSDEDLKNMGIENPKHRTKIMKTRPGGIKSVSFKELFAFADSFDYLLMFLGVVGAIGHGISLPIMTIYLGELMQGLFAPDIDKAAESVRDTALIFLYLGIGIFACGFPEVGFFAASAQRQSTKIREQYFMAILRQDMSWFDTIKSNQLASRIAGDVPEWASGISKLGTLVHFSTMFFAGFIFGFINGWQLTVVLLGAFPPLAISGGVMAFILMNITKKGQSAYAGAGGVAEETLGNMRTVASLCAEKRQQERYDVKLQNALKTGLAKSVATACGIGMMILIMFSTYSLALWYGATLITKQVQNAQTGEVWNGGNVITCFFSVLMGAMTVGQIGPCVEALNKGRGSAFRILETIHRVPEVDWESTEGISLDKIKGDVTFSNVVFSYPSRPNVEVLKSLSLSLPAGQTSAFVGSSGSGKSTVIQLLQRFYDPQDGTVALDGVDIRSLNVTWLRKQYGLVSQEPVLFATSIMENIRHGKDTASDDEVYEAAKSANAYNFVCDLPQQFKTTVGERGTQLSGGQKQRIAIARAIVRDPKILLLDEATSALDSESEKVVQDALDKLMKQRTTIVIAHRLSTVRDAHTIYVFGKGSILEQGTYNTLLSREGPFQALVRQQGGNNVTQNPDSEPLGVVVSMAEKIGEEGVRVDTLRLVDTDAEKNAQKKPDKKTVVTWTKDEVADWVKKVELPPVQKEMIVHAVTSEPGLSGKTLYEMSIPEFSTFCNSAGVREPLHVQHLEAELRSLRREHYHVPFMRVFKMNKPEWHFIFLGLLVATIHGGIMPSFAFIFSSMLTTFYLCASVETPSGMMYGPKCVTDPANKHCYSDEKECLSYLQSEANQFALYFLFLAIGTACVNFTQMYSFMRAGEFLTHRVRALCFAAMTRQSISFFDKQENTSGSLATKLSDDASKVQGAVGSGLGTFIQCSMTGVIGICLAFYFSWKLTLVVLAIMPVVVIGSRLQMKTMISHMTDEKEDFEKAGAIAAEGISGVRTVAAFGMHANVLKLFSEKLRLVSASGVKRGYVSGFGFAFGHFAMFLAYFVAFFVAGDWIKTGQITGDQTLKVFFVLIFSAMSGGQASSFAPNLALAKSAISYIFALHDSISEIDASKEDGEQPASVQGLIEMKDVCFSYPSRPDAVILRGINLVVQPGQTCALVGSSGSGKSTVIALLERFYNPISGVITLDGRDIKELNVQWLRRHMALVSQEPVLFDGTIRENIAFGNPSMSKESVEAAAKTANAHNFVMGLPDGYETEVGERGTQLSGGQKQRIAIARAVALEPNILLLDEATSALDNESEKLVQDALEVVMKGRTTVVIAHRLSTIQDADNIFVFDNGVVVESGTHNSLLQQQKFYSRLVSRQNVSQ